MLKRTEGIVLKTVPYGEADLVVTYLTPDLGIIKTFAKSPRKFKSRFGSSLEPLTHSKIAFWGKEDAALPRLTQSDILHSFQAIRDSLQCFLKLLEIIELTICFLPERDVHKKVFFLLLNILHSIEDKNNESLLINHYKIKFLQFVGFSPGLDACGRCGKKGNCFYIAQGSIMCEGCAHAVDSPIRISAAALKLYSDLLSWETAKISRIKPSKIVLSELSAVIDMHIQYILSKPLRSQAFINLFSSQTRC